MTLQALRAWAAVACTAGASAVGAACSPAVETAPIGADAAPARDASTLVAGSPGGATAAAEQACQTFAYQMCSYLQSCSATSLQNRFGDTATCQTVQLGTCLNSQRAPSTGASPAKATGCVDALSTWLCSDFLYGQNVPPACQTATGSLANGGSCGVNQQCQSGYCALPPNGACGTCAAMPPVGASCAEFVCPRSLACVAATQTCAAYAEQGASCSASQPCLDGVTCVGATATAPGTCEVGVATANSPCVFTGAGCDFYAGLACNALTGECETAQLQPPGAACGVVANQSASCIAGTCLRGACVANIPIGGVCDIASGPACISSSRCFVTSDVGTTGTCQLEGAFACP